ncbi:MAG: HAMP domain-containing sensor histidine kinase, partial [Mariprofundaceae bacterium]|nr:HAMP domain-containing sensor histidine kinase [Mariprofundaceae bacterium]
EANTHLQDLDNLKSMFIASMSHELRTPMNSILGFTDLILQGLSGDINDLQRDQLQRVHGAGKHLLLLITDIIDLSKVEAGKVEAVLRDFELDKLLDEAMRTQRVAADKKGLNLVLEPLAQGIAMHSDRQRLMQCLLNLISNAVKYSKTGSIHVSARQQGDEVIIGVQDSGIGMTEDEMAQLFQPFVRLDSELSIKAGGTGLGLYLTRKLATELLGGSLSVQSEAGVGSCFTLQVPIRLADENKPNKPGGKA